MVAMDRRTYTHPATGLLGPELPDTEAELFEIKQYPLVDLLIGVDIFEDDMVGRSFLKDIREAVIPTLKEIVDAH